MDSSQGGERAHSLLKMQGLQGMMVPERKIPDRGEDRGEGISPPFHLQHAIKLWNRVKASQELLDRGSVDEKMRKMENGGSSSLHGGFPTIMA